jgi:hypothetical protein
LDGGSGLQPVDAIAAINSIAIVILCARIALIIQVEICRGTIEDAVPTKPARHSNDRKPLRVII